MENMGIVGNFRQIAELLFGDDIKIKYEVKNEYDSPNDPQIIFYLTREIENVTYTAEKEYTMYITTYGILLSSKDGDKYFEKYNFTGNLDTFEDVLDVEDCPSFKS